MELKEFYKKVDKKKLKAAHARGAGRPLFARNAGMPCA